MIVSQKMVNREMVSQQTKPLLEMESHLHVSQEHLVEFRVLLHSEAHGTGNGTFAWKMENFLSFEEIMKTRKIFSKFSQAGGDELRIGGHILSSSSPMALFDSGRRGLCFFSCGNKGQKSFSW
ncbi:hypothetical protein K1719_001210 [Acacia pycnantha]|nr:hypothetical protein K1719_001210 [Acacia pycnantha]